MAHLAALSNAFLANPWLLWGVGPYIASNLGFLLTALLLEVVLASGVLDGAFLVYGSSHNAPRRKLLADTHKRISFK